MKLLSPTIAATLAVLPITALAASKTTTPNVIYILVDDLGYGDLSCYGQTMLTTPCIDALAQGGMRFTQFYAGCTVSAPSRCSLMTGKHTGHTHVRGNRSVKGTDGLVYDTPIPAKEFTLGELFKSKGYATAAVGKWGLGGIGSAGHPNKQGFDYYYGCLGQAHAHRYFPTHLHENSTLVQLDEKEYSHDLIEGKAVDFIKKNKDNPFFLYFALTLPHAELNLPKEYTTQFEGKFTEPTKPFAGKNNYCAQAEPYKVFASMVTRMDSSVGTIMSLLEELGIAENTMVVFSSDNGPHAEGGANPEYFKSSGIYRGIKRDLWEGGIRVPMIVNYPGVVKKGQESDLMGGFWDFMATFVELIGADVPADSDGISIMPTLMGKKQKEKHEYLYWEFHERNGRQAIRMGDWKLIRQNWKKSDKVYYELFNIAADPSELKNLAEAQPERVEQMKAIMDGARK